uniref:c-type cytochrome n=1 Tax=Salmonella enterica TaxID=28901 RepID=UPI003FD7E299
MRLKNTLASMAMLVIAGAALAQDPKTDDKMKQLASASGCLTCHGIDKPKPGPDGMPPIGPAWSDVAKQYKGKPGAAEFLTRIVLE